MRMEKQTGRERTSRSGHQRRKEFIPERDVVIAGKRLRKNKGGGNGRAEKRPDGACRGEDGPVQRTDPG